MPNSAVLWTWLWTLLLAVNLFPSVQAQEQTPAESSPVSAASTPADAETVEAAPAESSPTEATANEETLPPGHSEHGAAFNTGPRQRAYLMGDTGRVHMPISSAHPDAQSMFNQGLGQLHGFWFFEAERSFRQVTALDPNCAIAYWGMAMANEGNAERAKQFSAKAHELREHASPYEQKWIDAIHAAYHKKYADEKVRWQAFVDAIEDIVHAYPDDIEAKSLLALHLFWNKSGKALGVTSRAAVDALLDQVFTVEPLHPAHHYRIHLWDKKKTARAIPAAAHCGQSAPNIAHMWHMSGHIYSDLKRYEDAVWQQEASSRVDHRHMIHDHVLPTEIHNYTHNQEWLVRNLIKVGRIRDALTIARNLVEVPRHPKHNSPGNKSSAVVRGRTRLLDVLIQFELWEELLQLADTPYLATDDDRTEQIRKLRYVAVAGFTTGNSEPAQSALTQLEQLLAEEKSGQDTPTEAAEPPAASEPPTSSEQSTAVDNPAQVTDSADPQSADTADQSDASKSPSDTDTPAKSSAADSKQQAKDRKERLKKLEAAIAHIRASQAAAAGDHVASLAHLKTAGDLSPAVLARAHLAAGEHKEAEQQAKKAVDADKQAVFPLAVQALVLHQLEKYKPAREAFENLRKVSAHIDTDLSVFAELEPLAEQFGYSRDWLREYQHPADVGIRPELKTLGPLTWTPATAPSWKLTDSQGKSVSLNDYRGKPVVVIFYLGFGCLHCVEQLGTFSPLVEQFRQSGIEVLAIGTDEPAALASAIQAYTADKPLRMPLFSDSALEVFDAYRCVDNFENQALHGTFLIDGAGRIRWQDIGPDPFTDAEFLLLEARRLLELPTTETGSDLSPGVAKTR